MGFVVKNTTKCGLLDLLCPHSCRGCGQLGAVLCECCKKYMFEHKSYICPICKREFAQFLENVAGMDKMGAEKYCSGCASNFIKVWNFDWREGVVKKLVEEYKYGSVRAMAGVLAEMYDVAIPQEFGRHGEVTVVPLPTIGKHIRERGMDHTLILANLLAKRRGWRCQKLLARSADTVQVGAKIDERQQQAKKAYMLNGKFESERRYLLLDDVWTTGASMTAAADIFIQAGARKLYGVVLAVSRPKDTTEDASKSIPEDMSSDVLKDM